MMAGAGGAMRATGWRATAIRFQQFGAGGLLWHRSLSGRRARGQRRACEIDPAGCSTCASSLCGAVCGNGPVAGSRRRWFVGADRSARIRRRAGDDGPKARRGATNTTLAATQRHPCRSGMVTVDCARPRSCPETVVASGALKDQRKIPAFTISLTHSCARGADDGGRRRRDASYGVARDSHPVSTIRCGGLLWHRSLSGRRARGQRRACEIDPAGCSTCASSLCGAVCGNGPVAGSRRRWFVGADRSARIRRRAGDDGPKARRGATNTTLAATQRHPCRSGMVTVDCARPRSCPETVVASGALKDQRKIPAFTISLTHSCARGADDGGRRRRDASYGVARDSHPVSTIRCGGSLMASLAERTASPWTATSMRDRPCGVLDLRQQLVRRCVWQWTGRRQPTSMVCWCRSIGEDSAPRR